MHIAGTLSNVQIGGIAGQDLTANLQQDIEQDSAKKLLTQAEVVGLIQQWVDVLNQASLAPVTAEKAIKHLEVAAEEARAQEPDKSFAAKNLQRATALLRSANETLHEGTGLWQKIDPILTKLSPWLGVAAGFF